MATFLRTLIHAAIGGFAAGLATIPGSGPITARTVLLPALASAATSIFSLFTRNGTAEDRR
jgi:5-enolpyruvylshikimate-3-phosphate synthase